MRRSVLILLTALILIPLAFSSGQQDKPIASEKRESIHDRIVHIEKDFITEIPQVPRLCDRLDLKKQRINVGDCELYVEEEGKGTPLVLINGGPGGTHHCFHPWFSKAKDYLRVIYYDQRGCGLSDHQPGKDGYSVDQAVADLEAIRKALGVSKWAMLGYSYGGFLAQCYATKFPENLAGLILLGATPGMWVDLKRTRQYDFMSEEEQARLRQIRKELIKLAIENRLSLEKSMALVVYNNHINGDWKRQHYYRPSPEKLAQMALYEWNFDQKNNFRGAIGDSESKIDLTGAFDRCPIPTLILEGQWDLTWNTDKPEVLHKNHPGSKLVMFENAGHGIYDEDSDRFFMVLKEFTQNLPRVSPSATASFKEHLADWDRKQKASPLYFIRSSSWGRTSMEKLAKAYRPEWCDLVSNSGSFLFLKLGVAQYEVENYGEALAVFERMQKAAEKRQDVNDRAVALIWQGHMLDLLGKREDAIARYKQVAEMNNTSSMAHSQYGLQYMCSPYAKERMATPFVRVENRDKF